MASYIQFLGNFLISLASHFNGTPMTSDFKYVDSIMYDNDWIDLNATIPKNVHIGEGAIIPAGALVIIDIPPFMYDCTRFVYKGLLRKPYFC